jgi:hypothetical protein
LKYSSSKANASNFLIAELDHQQGFPKKLSAEAAL